MSNDQEREDSLLTKLDSLVADARQEMGPQKFREFCKKAHGIASRGCDFMIDEFVRMNPELEISHEQILYCRYLQSRGKRFCIDFGYENAEQMTWDDLGYGEPDFEWEVLNV